MTAVPAPAARPFAVPATIFVAFLAVSGIAVVQPVLPAIGAAIDVAAWQLELIFTAYLAVMAVGAVPAALTIGRVGLKPAMLGGLALIGVAAVTVSFSVDITQLSVLRGLWGFGNAVFFAAAIVVVATLAADQMRAVGRFETALGLGFAFGPVIGGSLGGVSWRLPFLTCGLLMAAGLGIVAYTVPRTDVALPPLRLRTIRATYSRPAFRALAAISALYHVMFFVVLGYSPLALDLDVARLGAVFAAWGLALAFGVLVVGDRLNRRVGRVTALGVAIAGGLASLLLLATSRDTAWSVGALVISGVFLGMANGNLTDLALSLGGPDRRAATCAYNLVRWGAGAPAPVLAGQLSHHGAVLPFWFGLAVLAAAAVIWLTTARVMAGALPSRSTA